MQGRGVAHALTAHYEQVISRLIEMGLFANRSEVVRAGLRELEERYLNSQSARAGASQASVASEEAQPAARVSRSHGPRKSKARPATYV
jgi:putative addiction module CopG family antidote